MYTYIYACNLSHNFMSMSTLGDEVTMPFLQDVIQWKGLSRYVCVCGMRVCIYIYIYVCVCVCVCVCVHPGGEGHCALFAGCDPVQRPVKVLACAYMYM